MPPYARRLDFKRMEGLLGLCGIALLSSVAALLVGRIKGEFTSLVRIGGLILVMGFSVAQCVGVVRAISDIAHASGVFSYAELMIKAVGLALVCKICSDICKDCGEGAVASGVELSGKLSILSLCIPLIKELMDYVFKILELT